MVKNLEAIKRRLARIPKVAREAAQEALRKEADDLAAAVKRNVPVDTGTLRDTVRVEPGAHDLALVVKVGGVPETRKRVRRRVNDADFASARLTGGFKGEYDYALGVEFGHRSMDGQHVHGRPFFFPTYRARRKGVRRRLNAATRKAVKQHFNR